MQNLYESLSRSQKSFNWRWFLNIAVAIVLSVLVAFIVTLSPFCGMDMYKSLLFHPMKYPVGDYKPVAVRGIVPSDHYFSGPGGVKLHAWFYQVPGAKHVLLWSHGNGGNVSLGKRYYDIFLAMQDSVFAYDYEGYGKSEGEPAMDNVCDDGHAAYHYLVDSLKVSPEKLILFGESLGTVVTGDLANTEKSAAVILQCPLYSVLDRGREIMPWLSLYPDWMWPRNGLNISRVFAAAHAPLLVIAGTDDHSTTVGQADKLVAAACQPKTYIRIPCAGHSDPAMVYSPMYSTGLQDFLMTH